MNEIRRAAAAAADGAVGFFRDIIRARSLSGREGDVVARIRREMEALGYDEVLVDGFGNVCGRVGGGPRVLAIDSHIDTVDVGDPSLWTVDPFGAELKDGWVYGRGAADQKGGMAASVWAGHLAKKLGLTGEATVWVTGSVLEEDCDGLAWQYILTKGAIRPEAVLITEPTSLNVYRGHRGRMEIEVETKGVSCHGSAPERGVNAVYKMAPIVKGVEKLHRRLARDRFLGKGSVTISHVRSTSPSLCAVADSCTIHLDRRLTAGEDEKLAVEQVRAIKGAEGADVRVLGFAGPSWTGEVFPTKKYYPTWAIPEDHPLCAVALAAYKDTFGRRAKAGKWTFSTNGVATMGMFGVPTVGFGPAEERFAHAPDERCAAADIGRAVEYYANFINRFATRGA